MYDYTNKAFPYYYRRSKDFPSKERQVIIKLKGVFFHKRSRICVFSSQMEFLRIYLTPDDTPIIIKKKNMIVNPTATILEIGKDESDDENDSSPPR